MTSILLRPSGADIFKTTCQAIVIPTNAVGTQGAGLAKLAAMRSRRWSSAYKRWCQEASPSPGSVCMSEFTDEPTGAIPHRWYIAVLTKGHWGAPSELPWIADGLLELERAVATEPELTSIAIPALGCGEKTGQLAWVDVEPLLLATAGRLAAKGLRVEIFEPWVSTPSRGRR